MNTLEKIQNLPKTTKKIILWSIVIILGLSFFIWRIRNFFKDLENFQTKGFIKKIELPEEASKIKTPQFSEEEINKLNEALKEAEESGTTTTP